MPGDQLAIVGHHAGYGPAKLCHAGGDLGDLVRAVDLGIARIGAQPINWLGFNLAWRKHQVHGVAFILGRAETTIRAGRCQRQDRDLRCQEKRKRPRGLSSGRNSSMIKG